MNIENNIYKLGFSARRIPQKTEIQISDKIKDIVSTLEPDSKKAATQLEIIGEKIAPSVYRINEYVLIPAPRYISDIMEDSKPMYMNNNSSILEYICSKELSPYNDLHIFKLQNAQCGIRKYDSNLVTDSAKQNFYADMKKLADSILCNSAEILNEHNWYISNDGHKIYNISPNLSGCITRTEYDTMLKTLFDKLFN